MLACLAVVVKLTSSYSGCTDLISLPSETPHRSQADGDAVLAAMTGGPPRAKACWRPVTLYPLTNHSWAEE